MDATRICKILKLEESELLYRVEMDGLVNPKLLKLTLHSASMLLKYNTNRLLLLESFLPFDYPQPSQHGSTNVFRRAAQSPQSRPR